MTTLFGAPQVPWVSGSAMAWCRVPLAGRSGQLRATQGSAEWVEDRWVSAMDGLCAPIRKLFCGPWLLLVASSREPSWKQAHGASALAGRWKRALWFIPRMSSSPGDGRVRLAQCLSKRSAAEPQQRERAPSDLSCYQANCPDCVSTLTVTCRYDDLDFRRSVRSTSARVCRVPPFVPGARNVTHH